MSSSRLTAAPGAITLAPAVVDHRQLQETDLPSRGNVGDGDMRSLIEARASELGVADKVEITGWVPTARACEEILAARALVLPGFIEGLPVVLMEAKALRRPVIASGVAGIPELVVSRDTGWLVAPGNVASWANAIIECIDKSDIDLRRMAEAVYARVIARHAIDQEAGKLAQLVVSAGASGHIAGPPTHKTHSHDKTRDQPTAIIERNESRVVLSRHDD